MNSGQSAPVSVGEVHEVNIDAVGGKGDGIAKIKGFVLFVPGVQKGDAVKIKITKVLQNVGFAEVVGQAEKAPPRQPKYATVSKEELEAEEEGEKSSNYEETDDFGEEE